MDNLILWAHLLAAAAMTALIWFTQLRTYPRFAAVPAAGFPAYHARYRFRVSMIAAPAMLAELATGVILLFRTPPGLDRRLFTVSVLLIVPIWFSTFAVQVPLHDRLAAGFEPAAHRRLVATNWVRTVGWTSRSVLITLAAAF